jgi:2-polyprenyl-3-methyl-5-hydroxy-6-metoxy-1,4-benzoquinol methylase
MVRADIDVLADLVPLAGREVVDVGCGDGSFMRALAARGASVVGIEVTEAAVARAGAGCLLGRADALPLDDTSVDVCVLMRSLHHVPASAMPRAFEECARVLRPGGAMYVAEPVAAGEYFEIVALVDDEREVRAQAQAAIAATRVLRRERTVDYAVPLRLTGFDAFRDRVVSADPARADRFAALEDELRARFAALEEDTAPMRADLLRRP